MGTIRYESALAERQNLMFGLNPSLIAQTLTVKNWRSRAIVRQRGAQRVYIFVAKRKFNPKVSKGNVYILNATDLDSQDRFGPFHWEFPTLAEALEEANLGNPIAEEEIRSRSAEVSIYLFSKLRPSIPEVAIPPGGTFEGTMAMLRAFHEFQGWTDTKIIEEWKANPMLPAEVAVENALDKLSRGSLWE